MVGNGQLLPNGHRVSVLDDEKVLEVAMLVAQHCECTKCH